VPLVVYDRISAHTVSLFFISKLCSVYVYKDKDCIIYFLFNKMLFLNYARLDQILQSAPWGQLKYIFADEMPFLPSNQLSQGNEEKSKHGYQPGKVAI